VEDPHLSERKSEKLRTRQGRQQTLKTRRPGHQMKRQIEILTTGQAVKHLTTGQQNFKIAQNGLGIGFRVTSPTRKFVFKSFGKV
jgi:hypothetical protein